MAVESFAGEAKIAAIRRYYIQGGPSSGYCDGKHLPGVYAEWLPADIVDLYALHDIVKERGWVRHNDGYYPQETIDGWKRRDAQEEADARDLALGRNFGASLARIEAKADEVKKDVGETRQGVGVLVQHLPDTKTPPHIEEAEAVAIMKFKGGDLTDRTLRNWLTTGVAGRVKYPISWADLATTESWRVWVESYLVKERGRIGKKKFVSAYAGKVEAEKSRRRSPTA